MWWPLVGIRWWWYKDKLRNGSCEPRSLFSTRQTLSPPLLVACAPFETSSAYFNRPSIQRRLPYPARNPPRSTLHHRSRRCRRMPGHSG